MAFDGSISEYLSLYCTLGFFDACLDIALWHWYDWLSWLGLRMLLFFMYFISRLVWYIDMPIIIDCSSCLLGMAILSLPDYFAHFTCIDSLLYVVWLAVLFPLACILSWSSFEHDVCIVIRPDNHSFFARTWVIYLVFCLIACCMTALLLRDCMSPVSVGARISPYLQLSWFWSFISSRFSLLQVWDLLCACSLIEPEIRSRV